jgi:hypothetical protein
LEKGKGWTGLLVPGFVVDLVEPLLQATSDFAMTTLEKTQSKVPSMVSETSAGLKGKAQAWFGFMVSAIKLYAPESVNSLAQFVIAMVRFFFTTLLVY